jgi:hypothetical protein
MSAENTPPSGWYSLLKQKVVDFLHWCGRVWNFVLRWYQLLQPARACLLASVLVPVLFIAIDQGQDTLRKVASEGVSLHAFWMVTGMWVAGLTSWAWARFLLNCDFPMSNEVLGIDQDEAKKARHLLQRSCGLLPPLAMAAAFLFAADNSGVIPQCLILAGVSFGIAVLLWCSFEPLHRWHTRQSQRVLPEGRQTYRYRNLADIRADAFTKWAIVATWTTCAAIFVAVTRWPVSFGEVLGSPAVILFAIAVWISLGSVFLYLANRYRFPLFTFLFLWVVFCSLFNDNHDIRTLPTAHSAGSTNRFTAALDQWYADVSRDYPLSGTEQKRPLYLVASAGGGIRAAYWTAIVLGDLEESARSKGTSFAAHTFLLSGVSGGSLGEVTFASLLVHGPANGTNFCGSTRKLLGQDFLAADLAKMAFADLLQRFLPFPINKFDRAQSLEDAWAAAWKSEFKNDVFNESLGELYADAADTHVLLPHLMLNGTCVETGQRIITSDLTLHARVKSAGKPASNGNFLDALIAAEKLSNAPIRLSTAVHQSARFTYFSPAGRFPDGTHVVDGGYFENSGASTLMDALSAIQWRIKTNHWTDIEPRIILIDNDPIPRPASTNNWFSQLFKNTPGHLLRETLSPVRALLNTRTARGSYATEQALNYNWAATNIYQFDLYQRKEGERLGNCTEPAELPLGWTLSRCAMDEMDAQLKLPFERATNSVTISNIIAALPRYAPVLNRAAR